MSRVINLRGIPDELFRDFKAQCAFNDVDMTEALQRLMRFYVAKGKWEISKEEVTGVFKNLFLGIEQAIETGGEFNVKKKSRGKTDEEI